MATNTSFQLFSSSNDKPNLGLGFLESSEPQLPPPPPPVEVLSSEVSSSVKYTVEPVNLDGLTLLKGRVSTKEVLGLPDSDLVPGIYEGGLKLWEGSLDLVKALRSEIQNGCLSFEGKRVLELGCGHGLPGIFACLESAAEVHFQDFNAEVLRCLTIPNVNANLLEKAKPETVSEVRFFAGDWGAIHQLLPHARESEINLTSSSEHGQASAYDVILMAETIYSISVQRNLYGLIKKCMNQPNGVVYLAGKKHYFGVGGGTRQFLSMLEKEGVMAATLVTEVADGSSNVRELKKLKVERQARAKERTSSSRVGIVFPNIRFLGLVSFCVIGPSSKSSQQLVSFGTFFLVGLREHFDMYRLICFVEIWYVNF